MSWADYINHLRANNVCQTAYILGLDGAIWATSQPIQQMPKYQVDVPDQSGEKSVKHVIDEKANILQALKAKGVCKHPAGIRIYNQKYYSVNFNDQKNTWYLKKQKGGACIAICNKCVIIGSWSSQQKMTNNVAQNPGQCNQAVQTLAATLRDSGY